MDAFIETTIEMAKRSALSVSSICAGANVQIRWYHKFINGEFKDPGYSKVTRLHNYLLETERQSSKEDAA